MGKPSKIRKRSLLSADNAIDALLVSMGASHVRQLLGLWASWEVVMGADIACLGVPLGSSGATLLIGADDNMAMQELVMQTDEILERANAFMDSEFFAKVRVALRQDRRSLTDQRPRRVLPPLPGMPPPLPGLGGLMGRLDPNSPITACYEAYVRAFRGE